MGERGRGDVEGGGTQGQAPNRAFYNIFTVMRLCVWLNACAYVRVEGWGVRVRMRQRVSASSAHFICGP